MPIFQRNNNLETGKNYQRPVLEDSMVSQSSDQPDPQLEQPSPPSKLKKVKIIIIILTIIILGGAAIVAMLYFNSPQYKVRKYIHSSEDALSDEERAELIEKNNEELRARMLEEKEKLQEKYKDLNSKDMFKDLSVVQGQVIKSPLIIQGKVDAYWIGEGYCKVRLFNRYNIEIASTYANVTAYPLIPDSDGFLPFMAELVFKNPNEEGTGRLVFEEPNNNLQKGGYSILVKFEKSNEDLTLRFEDPQKIIGYEREKSNFLNLIEMYDISIKLIEGYNFNDGSIGGFSSSNSEKAKYLEYTSSTLKEVIEDVWLNSQGVDTVSLAKIITIPKDANFLFFDYKFNFGALDGSFEVFLGDDGVFGVETKDQTIMPIFNILESSFQNNPSTSGWKSVGIPIEKYQGKELRLLFRLVNLDGETDYSSIEIDNIIFANVSK